MKVEQVAIVGAGPAGLAAAIQLKRNGINALLLERDKVGGLLWNANLVENYPGFPKGISGPKLVGRMIRQAHSLGINPIQQEVINITYEQESYQLTTSHCRHEAGILVIATGTKPKALYGFSVPKNLASKVYYEVRSLLNKKNERMVIIGSGDAAFDYALNLSKKNMVSILNRGTEVRCLPLLWERAQKVADISYREQTQVLMLRPDKQGGMLVDCQGPAGELQFHADYLIGAVGREAELSWLSDSFCQQVQVLQDMGVLYVIGDVKNGIYRQTSIAVGDGVMAAMKICRCLKENAK